jgi:hypothetical protein
VNANWLWERVASVDRREHLPIDRAPGAAGQPFLPSVPDLVEKSGERLTEIRHDDLEELWSLRVSGKERIWAIRERSVFRVLWWDPEHHVYVVEKKHT